MTSTPSRDVETRKKDVLAYLESQGHYWLSTAEVGGRPYVIAVSAWWDGAALVVATLGGSRTARNMAMSPSVVLAGGDPSDAIVIQASVVESQAVEDAPDLLAGFEKALGWAPGKGWALYRLRPTRIQAFRGYEEIEGRDVMVRSRWLA